VRVVSQATKRHSDLQQLLQKDRANESKFDHEPTFKTKNGAQKSFVIAIVGQANELPFQESAQQDRQVSTGTLKHLRAERLAMLDENTICQRSSSGRRQIEVFNHCEPRNIQARATFGLLFQPQVSTGCAKKPNLVERE
jgi:hypothetical protein